MFPTSHTVSEPPEIGQKAPQTEKLEIGSDGKPTLVTFLRHCGCPCTFALQSDREQRKENGGNTGKRETREQGGASRVE
jgi:hypothetical protein